MYKIILKSILIMCLSASCYAQSSEEKSIKSTIIAFSKAADENDAKKLAGHLDGNFRIVMNRLFGSEEVSVMNKEVYLEKIESKEYGGDDRKVKLESILLNGTVATAKVSFEGSKMTFISLLTLLKNKEGEWKIVSDVPIVK